MKQRPLLPRPLSVNQSALMIIAFCSPVMLGGHLGYMPLAWSRPTPIHLMSRILAQFHGSVMRRRCRELRCRFTWVIIAIRTVVPAVVVPVLLILVLILVLSPGRLGVGCHGRVLVWIGPGGGGFVLCCSPAEDPYDEDDACDECQGADDGTGDPGFAA